MIASRPLATSFGSDRSALDLPVAALAGLAVAFAAFTIPNELLAEAVGATGIASFFAAAQPPLGTTARLTLAVAGALVAFGGAYFLLRWLDRFAAGPSAGHVAPAPDAPRVHKADAHPDAPAPRPISALRDLGEPAPPVAPMASPKPAERAVAVEPPAAAPESLGALMARLERGLARRETQAEPAQPSDVVHAEPERRDSPAPPIADIERPASNDRLQSAIEGLRSLSGQR